MGKLVHAQRIAHPAVAASLQAFFLCSHIVPYTSIKLAGSELFAHLCEINLCGELERHRHVPLLKGDIFCGVFDLHDGCGKRSDLVFREVKVLQFGRAFNIDTCLL